jgi:hypothetical protein
LEFCFFFWVFFFQVLLQQESILFGLLKISQTCLELVAGRQVVGLWGNSLAGQWTAASRPVVRWWWCGGGSLPVLSVYHGMEKLSMG